jgi:hypothetical protein
MDRAMLPEQSVVDAFAVAAWPTLTQLGLALASENGKFFSKLNSSCGIFIFVDSQRWHFIT